MNFYRTNSFVRYLVSVFNLSRIRHAVTLLLTLFLVLSAVDERGLYSLVQNTNAQSNEVELISITLEGDTIKQPGDPINYVFELSQEIGEVTSISVGFKRSFDGQVMSIGFALSAQTDGRFITTQGMTIQPYNYNGEYDIDYVSLWVDEAHHVFYFNSEPLSNYDFNILTGNFEVINSNYDVTPPTMDS